MIAATLLSLFFSVAKAAEINRLIEQRGSVSREAPAWVLAIRYSPTTDDGQVLALVWSVMPDENRVTSEVFEKIGEDGWKGHPWSRARIEKAFGPPEGTWSFKEKGQDRIKLIWRTSAKWPGDDMRMKRTVVAVCDGEGRLFSLESSATPWPTFWDKAKAWRVNWLP